MTDPVSAAATAAATAVSKKVFDKLAQKFSDRILGATAAAADRVAVAFRVGFSEYLETSYNRCALFKTIIAPSEPLDVLAHYVHVSLTCGSKKLSDDELLRALPKLRCVVVTGLAGSGKSMFMRYLTLVSFNQGSDTIPLFIELRRLNSFKDKNLLAFVRNECTSKLSVISESQFNLSLKSGTFLLILDGFDELNNDLKQDIGQQILDIRKDFNAVNIVVSSRPDDRFASWAEFHVFRVDAMTKEQTIALINILPYDIGVKTRFVNAIKKHLYSTHKSFMSSPLLATIMLLTFTAFGDDGDDPYTGNSSGDSQQTEGTRKVPNNMYSFYAQAFDTLFQKHDATKEQYRRRINSDLALGEFKNYFSAFCAISYLKEQYDFTEETLLDTADRAGRYWEQQRSRQEIGSLAPGLKARRSKTKVPAKSSKAKVAVRSKPSNPEAFVKDLIDSVCMLHRDGQQYSFVHRSFQEYFAALFIVSESTERIPRILDAYCVRFNDNVMTMLFDMHRLPVEKLWVTPVIAETRSLIPTAGSIAHRIAQFCKGVSFMFAPTLVLHNSVERQLLISIIAPNKLIFGRFLTLCKFYPGLPADITGNFMTLEEAQTSLLQNKYRGKLNYDRFYKFFNELDTRPHRTSSSEIFQSTRIETLSDEDEWWLAELGFGKHISEIHTSLGTIANDIESRASECNSIIDEVLSI